MNFCFLSKFKQDIAHCFTLFIFAVAVKNMLSIFLADVNFDVLLRLTPGFSFLAINALSSESVFCLICSSLFWYDF